MRSLTETLIAAQKEATHIPAISLTAKNSLAGVTRLNWTRLYSGSEDEGYHAVTSPGDGSLVRARITPLSDARKLYLQRVASPSAQSDFSQWTYTNMYNAIAVATASQGAEVSIFAINASWQLAHFVSTDYGATWPTGEVPLMAYLPPGGGTGALSAAYKPNGDIGLFFISGQTLYVKKRLSGQWQGHAAWDKTTGNLSSVAAVYNGDWKLLVSGQNSSGDYKLWSIVYGDGAELAAGSWSELKELASAPSGGNFEYRQLFMDKPDTCRALYVEDFTGSEAASRVFWSYALPEANFTDNLWREPIPFNYTSQYGLAISHYGDYCWLSSANCVWQAPLAASSLELTPDVLCLKQEEGERSARLTVELYNEDGRYANPGQGELAALTIGADLEFCPGYITSQGKETSSGPVFNLEGYEHINSGGHAALRLYATSGWNLAANWLASHQFRWNKGQEELSVTELLAFILARAGLKLEVNSQSSTASGYYPDFTLHPGDHGETVLEKLLSLVPDVIFVEGNKAYLVNPLAEDAATYAYGTTHAIFEAVFKHTAFKPNHIRVEGLQPTSGEPIITNCFEWAEIGLVHNRLKLAEDSNIETANAAAERGQAYLRQAAIASGDGFIVVAVNCGQQLYDVISVTDGCAGQDADKWRVLGQTLTYDTAKGLYRQRLRLGAV